MQADRKRIQEQASQAVVATPNHTTAPVPSSPPQVPKRKRKPKHGDEIDVVFGSTKKMRKAALNDLELPVSSAAVIDRASASKREADGMRDVLCAIRVAPKAEGMHEKRRRT